MERNSVITLVVFPKERLLSDFVSMMRICKFSHSWPARTQLFDHDTSKQDIFVDPHRTLWTALAEVCGNLLVKH